MSFLTFLILFSFQLKALPAESIKAQVGEEIISQIDLKSFRAQLKKKTQALSLLQTFYKPSQLLKDEKLRLKFLIERSLILQLAQKQKLTVDSTKLEKELSLFLQKTYPKNKRFSKKTTKATSSFDIAPGDLEIVSLTRKTLKENLQINQILSQSVFSKVSVSEQDIESYHFAKYKKPLSKLFEYEFSSLSFPESKKNAVLKAREFKTLESLEELSKKLNLEYKKSRLQEAQINQAFKTELDKLSVSQVSPLILVGDTYFLLQLSWKSALISPKEQEKKARIEKNLYEQKLKQVYREWIEEQKSQFFIKTDFR